MMQYLINLMRSTFLWATIFLCTTIMFLFIYLPAILCLQRIDRQKIVHRWGKVILWLTQTHIEIIQPKKKSSQVLSKNLKAPLIIIANHKSWIDIPVLAAFLELSFVFLAKKSLFQIPLVGLILRSAGYIPVERKNKKAALKSFALAAHSLQKQNSALIIFPEGRRTRPDESLAKYKTGAFLLAQRSQIPVQAIVIFGTEKIIPANQKKFVQRIFKNKVYIKLLPQVVFSNKNTTKKTSALLQQEIFEKMKKEYLALKKNDGK